MTKDRADEIRWVLYPQTAAERSGRTITFALLPRTSHPFASAVLPGVLERKKPPAREALKLLI